MLSGKFAFKNATDPFENCRLIFFVLVEFEKSDF